MGKIFVSHSSRDKEFVNKFSVDLITAGLPIWLDAWELEIGDSLYDKIYTGIDNSSYVIIILSKNYNKSLWTSKEFKAVLQKEDATNRKYLIPLKIDDCEVPLPIADRIYKDLTSDYALSVKELIRFFKSKDLLITDVAFNERTIPLSFRDYVYLDKPLLWNSIVDFNELGSPALDKKQLLLTNEELLYSLSDKLKASDVIRKFPSMLDEFQGTCARVEKLISFFKNGVLLIVNKYNQQEIELRVDSIYWYSRQVIETILSLIERHERIHKLIKNWPLDFKPVYDGFCYFEHTKDNFCKLYSAEDFRQVMLYNPKKENEYFKFYVDTNTFDSMRKTYSEIFSLRKLGGMFAPKFQYFMNNYDLIYKFLIPQNVFAHTLAPQANPLLTKFEEYYLFDEYITNREVGN